jgi:hypothetical protein
VLAHLLGEQIAIDVLIAALEEDRLAAIARAFTLLSRYSKRYAANNCPSFLVIADGPQSSHPDQTGRVDELSKRWSMHPYQRSRRC